MNQAETLEVCKEALHNGMSMETLNGIISEVKEKRPNTLDKLIARLNGLRADHGGDCRVMAGNEHIVAIEHVPAVGVCDEYINIE
jgi:hypothetical protein